MPLNDVDKLFGNLVVLKMETFCIDDVPVDVINNVIDKISC